MTVHHRDSPVDGDAPDARFDRAPSVSDFLPSPSLPVRGFSDDDTRLTLARFSEAATPLAPLLMQRHANHSPDT